LGSLIVDGAGVCKKPFAAARLKNRGSGSLCIFSFFKWFNSFFYFRTYIERYRNELLTRYFHGDAAFANPEIYRLLETEDYFYAIRLKGNTGVSYKSARKLSQKREILTVRVDSCKIIDIVLRKACFLTV